jgi:hypothetical protein
MCLCQLQLTTSRSNEFSSLPKYAVEINVKSLHIHLSDQQIQRLLHLLTSLTTPSRQPLNVFVSSFSLYLYIYIYPYPSLMSDVSLFFY